MSLISEARDVVSGKQADGTKLAEMVVALYKKVLKDSDHELLRDDPDFLPGDLGNFDDAYNQGAEDGEIIYAGEIWREMEKMQ